VVIEAEKANYSVAGMCRLLGVPRSSFFAWRNRVETPTAARRQELASTCAGYFTPSNVPPDRHVPASLCPCDLKVTTRSLD
jgi:hypothetical protein